jgi:hypothetical protein
MKIIAAFTLLLAVSACATPEARLRTGLLDAGLSNSSSACMARYMVSRLSLGQLIRLSSLGNLKDKPVGDMSVTEFLHSVRALQDVQILSIASKSALACSLLG